MREKDRQAIVLRFYEGRNLREIGLAQGTGEEAAEKRVSRALDKLRAFFTKRGVSSTSAIIAGAMTTHSVQAAPVALAKSVTALAMTKGAAASASTLTLIKRALKIMAWTKVKTAIVVGVGILLAAGTTVTIKESTGGGDERIWRTPYFAGDVFERAAPEVTILPTKFPNGRNGQGASGNRWLGIDQPLNMIFGYAHDWPYGRIVFDSGNLQTAYDMIANLPQGSAEALQREIKNKLYLVGHVETRDMDVLLLKVSRPNAPGLKPPSGEGYSDPWGHFSCHNQRISTGHPSEFCLAIELELLLGKPVIDQTGLSQKFNIDLEWNGNHPSLNLSLFDQLGLELVPTNIPVEMLVVEKTK
jgi:hypothetical protein